MTGDCKLVCSMKFTHFVWVIALSCHNSVYGQVTFLDKYRPEYRSLRNTLFNFIGRTDGSGSYYANLKNGKVQEPFPENQPLFCDPNGPGRRSNDVPNSVHKLRPGDIDVIASIGDSLTAGNGALATNILQVFIENRGVSWSIGGQGNWRKYLTLPNIIKEFNPDLYGYSLADGHSTHKRSRFNTAEIGAMSRDLPHQAKVLVKRMTSDPRVKIKEHWKLITILIGPNDFCLDMCYAANPEKSVDYHEKDLITTLRTLRNNLPRTMVNLVTPPSMRVITELRGKPAECESTHHIECPCAFGFAFRKKRKYYFDIMERWKEVVSNVSQIDEFNTEDFTVNNQPFLKNVTFPVLPNGNNDFSYMSMDCFHLSQKGYARAANALWNNMLEPEGQKSTNWKKEFSEFLCPTVSRPYLATKKNS
ncbi:Phospholipase B1, membrane-associated [Pseudolycoriella hygida]|uniref:Phospholipase B1, membrane-associated n=1 Tax=Pseudolycoriella hygida TaxID=35572 RepID=A0A9Q0S594_9DIPT|nr:Phospholipase B1, membrane-associated [Pseudolycoriella hygida]